MLVKLWQNKNCVLAKAFSSFYIIPNNIAAMAPSMCVCCARHKNNEIIKSTETGDAQNGYMCVRLPRWMWDKMRSIKTRSKTYKHTNDNNYDARSQRQRWWRGPPKIYLLLLRSHNKDMFLWIIFFGEVFFSHSVHSLPSLLAPVVAAYAPRLFSPLVVYICLLAACCHQTEWNNGEKVTNNKRENSARSERKQQKIIICCGHINV